MLNIRATLRFLGRLLLVLAAAELLPTVCCLLYGEFHAALGFLATAGITGALGWLATRIPDKTGELYRREGILIVVCGWILASLFGALPYVLTGTLEPMDALFESTSGFTTTGATVMTDIESSGRGILFWRSFSQWLGGMGIIVLFVALLPELGPGARFLYQLEVPGPTAETLRPRVRDTAVILWRIYLLLSGVLVVLLMLLGLDLYDALTHTFSTLSSGGFSPYNASIAAFDSIWVELVIIVFMILAGTNFSLYYGLRHTRGRNFLRDPEFKIYLLVIFGVSTAIAIDLMIEGRYTHGGQAFLDSLFHVLSVLTTTGFVTVDYDVWPSVSRALMICLMFMGACAGSTSGGQKIMRLVVGFKSALREVRQVFSPSTVLAVFVGGKAVPDTVVRSVAGFSILYLFFWVLGTLLLSIGGLDIETAASASIATLGNVGPGLHEVGPTGNFSFFASWQKLVMVVLMWLGRLELYAITAVATLAFWRR